DDSSDISACVRGERRVLVCVVAAPENRLVDHGLRRLVQSNGHDERVGKAVGRILLSAPCEADRTARDPPRGKSLVRPAAPVRGRRRTVTWTGLRAVE